MNQQAWNQFVLAHGPRSGRFLQSWEWGEFQRAVGETVRREAYEQDGEVVGIGQWVDREVRGIGSYASCAKGPIVWGGEGGLVGGGGSRMFERIEPETIEPFARARKTIDVNPAHTLITDVSIGEDALLAQMHQKTRYNIGVAKRRGVEVELEAVDFGSAWELFTETSARGQFRLHPRVYYESMLAMLGGTACNLFLAIGKIGSQVLAANILVDFGDTRTYLHGASSDRERNAMAPYLLHWELMRDARTRALRWYDWWGVSPVVPPLPEGGLGGVGVRRANAHAWSGLSRFKRGFGGTEVAVPGTYDLVLDPARYVLYRLARHAARIIRRYV